ncbi:MAG: large subunit ribosomal protein L21e [Candidatus Methanomethylophilaceae archaeon]|nr:large subunit ribosomal protein L21e [Candidatus Methanomethylophilaceae archaeon]MDI3541517.1 large subunit ribosomal protein L21e [Candidatus Methanomethylophilaceae archaeon]
MVKASRGTRNKTRKIMRRNPCNRGLSPVTKEFIDYEVGEKVNIVIDPSVHKGMPFRRFQGLTGTVAGRQGRAVVVNVKAGNKMKTVVARPEHLTKVD